MGIKVIGAGLGRTGTMSLKLALEQLGYGKCFHMFELFQQPERVVHFENAAKGLPVDWKALFEGYESAVDLPVSEYYEQLAAYYPEAKVILTVHDSESWFKSSSDTILKAGKPGLVQFLSILLKALGSPLTRRRIRIFKYNGGMTARLFGKDVKNKNAVVAKYEAFNERAKKGIAPDRLLVFNVKDGWEPLCRFLDVPVPATPFPKSNSTEDFWEHVAKLRSE